LVRHRTSLFVFWDCKDTPLFQVCKTF